jgi:AraC family ethanolamine operon transcriptional activator
MMLRQRFQSFEEYAASLGHRDLRVLALGPARQRWESARIDLNGIPVRWARDGGPCVFEGSLDVDVVGLMVCVDATGKMIGNGTAFGRDSVMVVPRRHEIRVTSLDAIGWITALIPTSRLGPMAVERRDFSCGVIDARITGEPTFSHALMGIARAAMAGAFDGNPLGRRDASQRLVAAASTLLGAPSESPMVQSRAGRRRMSRVEVIQLVERWLDDETDRRPSLCALAQAAGVSHRTLHNAFVEQLGVSPKRFLRLRLLNAVRRELTCAGGDDRRVTDVVSRLGVWDWGRFSGEYSRLFGELPSETLRRTRWRR